ncbi:genetic suppressor element 1-like, partial [Penaeus indicus]|uniref:genetic suppressor element 1-like n=1 Tax=Penaeus indicus TaxID=29960 RepID=UPI00300D1E10
RERKGAKERERERERERKRERASEEDKQESSRPLASSVIVSHHLINEHLPTVLSAPCIVILREADSSPELGSVC